VSERLLTAAELADRLALSTSTVLDWFGSGRLPEFKFERVVRFREDEVLDWIEAPARPAWPERTLVSGRTEEFAPWVRTWPVHPSELVARIARPPGRRPNRRARRPSR
jgi:excisionase family DNA binding protein